MDEKIKNGETCSICGQGRVIVSCLSCGLPVCEHCACYEMNSSGCCFAWPTYTCLTCAGKHPEH